LLGDTFAGIIRHISTSTSASILGAASAAASNDQHIHGDQVRVRDTERAAEGERVDGIVAVVRDVAAGGEKLGGRTTARVVVVGRGAVVGG
jgi:hypothetical protein